MDPRSELAPWYLKLAFIGSRLRPLAGVLFVVLLAASWFADGSSLGGYTLDATLVQVGAGLTLLSFVMLAPAKWLMRLNEQARLVRG